MESNKAVFECIADEMFDAASEPQVKTPPVAGRQMGHPQKLLPVPMRTGALPLKHRGSPTELQLDRRCMLTGSICVIDHPRKAKRRFSPKTRNKRGRIHEARDIVVLCDFLRGAG